MTHDLKPCPFCGSRAEFQKAETGDGEPAEYVTCTKCSASTALCYPCMDGPRDHLAYLWNSRGASAPEQIEAAAKKLAEVFDYPWEHMPEQGRATMRNNAIAVIGAALAAR